MYLQGLSRSVEINGQFLDVTIKSVRAGTAYDISVTRHEDGLLTYDLTVTEVREDTKGLPVNMWLFVNRTYQAYGLLQQAYTIPLPPEVYYEFNLAINRMCIMIGRMVIRHGESDMDELPLEL